MVWFARVGYIDLTLDYYNYLGCMYTIYRYRVSVNQKAPHFDRDHQNMYNKSDPLYIYQSKCIEISLLYIHTIYIERSHFI